MDEDTAMTVPPPLPAKAQARGTGQGTRQTVSIRAISPSSSPSLTTGAGATVFVGVSSPAADSTATCRRRIPEVQSTNGFARPTSVHTSQQLQLHQQQQQQQQQPQHQSQPQQQQQQAAHVVKIKINTDGDKNSRVISTVRLNLDGNIGRGLENGITCERAKKRDGAGVVSATNLVNETRCGSGVGEACVRISVGGDASERQESNYINNNNSGNLNNNNNHNNHNNNNNNNHNASNNNRYKHIERGSNGSAARNNGHSQSDNDNEIEKDMVQRGTADTLNNSPLNNRSSGCFYYSSFQSPLAGMVMSSGQCSPSDTLDSGTCSDLDGTPPPLPKKKNASTVILAGTQHNRTGSLTSSGAEVDSDDNESNISCDSLNGRELAAERILASDGDNVNGSSNEAEDIVSSYGSRSNDLEKLKDEGEAANGVASKFELIRLTNGDRRKVDDDENDDGDDDEDDEDKRREAQRRVKAENDAEVANGSRPISRSVSPSPSGSSSSMSKASSTPRVRSPELPSEPNGRLSSPMVKECTYEERKQEQERIEQECAAADFYANYNRSSGNKYVYDDDRFYKFHVNELRGDSEDSSPESKEIGLGDKETDECFAGYKILEREAIRSAKGTVRGVKNRVRAGIATFLQKPSSKAYKAKEEGKVVVYTTTSGIVRQTFYNCMKVKQILRTHMVKYDERDLFRSAELQTELRDRIGCTAIQVPQLFIDGQYIGDADTVERLNESGELRRILKPYKTEDACTVCLFCGGYQLLLCPVCNGSKRSVHRNDFTVEFVALKCMNCDEVGLVRCPHC